MKKMLFTLLTVGTMVPAAASGQDVPLGTPVDTARMSTRAVSPETRARILELRQRAEETRARVVAPRARALERAVEPRMRVLERSVQPRLEEAQRRLMVERARGAAQARRVAPAQQRLREAVRVQGRELGERRMLVERELQGVRRAMPLRAPMMMELSEDQREKMRKLQEDHAEKRRDLDEKRRDLDEKRRDLEEKRRELDREHQQKLRELLTDAQRARAGQERTDR